jgi:hypothetical protein
MVECKCQVCGVEYEKPDSYIGLSNVFFTMSLKYCDVCRKAKQFEALKSLPQILEILSKNKDEI